MFSKLIHGSIHPFEVVVRAHTHMIATVIKCWSNEFCIILLCQIPTGIVDFAVKDKVMKIQNIASSFITRKTATQVPDSVGSSL
jgi:hypothetical protein